MRNVDLIRDFINSGSAVLIKSKSMKKYINTITGGAVDVLLTQNRDYLILDGRYTAEAELFREKFEIIENTPAVSGKNNFEIIEEICDKNRIDILFVETEAYKPIDYIKMMDSKVVTLRPFDEHLKKIRMKKSSEEINVIKEACDITDRIFLDTIKHIKVGITENEISGWIHFYSMKYGAEGMSFSPVISSGYRTAYPHARPTDKKVEISEPIMIDFGIIYKGYQSDMTRMVFVGEPTEKIKEIYRIVKESQQAGLDAIRKNIQASEVDKAARDVIEKYGYKEYFSHGLGHGIGMDNSSELPKLNQTSDIILDDGMVMSCEPGIYISGVGGIRIEDSVCIENGVGVSMNKVTKDMIILEV